MNILEPTQEKAVSYPIAMTPPSPSFDSFSFTHPNSLIQILNCGIPSGLKTYNCD